MLNKKGWFYCINHKKHHTFAEKVFLMTISSWVYDKTIHGFSTFSVEDVKKNFVSMPSQYIQTELNNLVKKTRIAAVYRGFYVIIPAHYVLRGVVPPLYYVDQLMNYLGKPYYVSLLNAAELLGAAHQRPQTFSITTLLPQPRISAKKNPLLSWTYRREIEEDFLLTGNTETGIVKYSSAELTALDLVQYSQNIGGLSRAATILEELCEVMDMNKFTDKLCKYTTLASLQRLGYILEHVLFEQEKADVIYERIKASGRKMLYTDLNKESDIANVERDQKWKIKINCEIETDDI
jgi:predicted transcriptional regulator of viral defense system